MGHSSSWYYVATSAQIHHGYGLPLYSPLVFIVSLEFPRCWELDARFHPDADQSDSDDEEDPRLPPSVAYGEFLRFLELGCRGSPTQAYPALVIVLSTIPLSVRALILERDHLIHDSWKKQIMTSLPSESPIDDFFFSFWSAVDSRAFGMTNKTQTFTAFAHAFVDCLLLLAKRLQNSTPNIVCSLVGGNLEVDRGPGGVLRGFIHKQTTRLVEGIFHGHFQLDSSAAIRPLSEIVTRLDGVDKGPAAFIIGSTIR